MGFASLCNFSYTEKKKDKIALKYFKIIFFLSILYNNLCNQSIQKWFKIELWGFFMESLDWFCVLLPENKSDYHQGMQVLQSLFLSYKNVHLLLVLWQSLKCAVHWDLKMEIAEKKKEPLKKLWVFGIQRPFNKMHGRHKRRDI